MTMPSQHTDVGLDEILRAISVYQGITTADGNVGGTTLEDSTLIGSNDFISGKTILLQSGLRLFEDSGAVQPGGFAPGTGITTVSPAFGGRVFRGTAYYVLNHASAKAVMALLAAILAAIATGFTLSETGGTILTDGFEQDVYLVNAPAGVFAPKRVQIDFTNQTAAETVVVRTKYRIKAGGGLVKEDEVAFVGVQDPALKTIVLHENRFGVSVTLERTAGGAFNYDWEPLYES